MPKFGNFLKSNKWQKGIIALWILLIIITQGCISKGTKIYRVGILCGIDSVSPTIGGFKSKMDELGYHEGKNILYDIHKINFDPVEEKHIIKRFMGEKVDLIFAFPHDAALTAKNITQRTDMPVIFAYVNMEDINFVNSLREPGGNITGIQHPLEALTGKRFELLLEFDPTIQNVWVAYDAERSIFTTALTSLREAAQSKHINLVEVSVSTLDDIKRDFEMRENMPDIGIDSIFIMPDQFIQTQESWILIRDFAQKHNLPISANVYGHMVDGALFHLGNDYVEVGAKAATLADKILRGTHPSELPVLSPEGYLRINLISAKALGLTVPEGLLKQATEIIR